MYEIRRVWTEDITPQKKGGEVRLNVYSYSLDDSYDGSAGHVCIGYGIYQETDDSKNQQAVSDHKTLEEAVLSLMVLVNNKLKPRKKAIPEENGDPDKRQGVLNIRENFVERMEKANNFHTVLSKDNDPDKVWMMWGGCAEEELYKQAIEEIDQWLVQNFFPL